MQQYDTTISPHDLIDSDDELRAVMAILDPATRHPKPSLTPDQMQEGHHYRVTIDGKAEACGSDEPFFAVQPSNGDGYTECLSLDALSDATRIEEIAEEAA